MNLTGFRTAVAAALAAIPDVAAGDWVVLPEPSDAVQPPCFMLQWGPDPARVIDTVCTDTVSLEVIAVAGRLTIEGAYPILETMWDQAVTALTAARLRPWQSLAPGSFEIARVAYLAARIQIRQPVTTEPEGVP